MNPTCPESVSLSWEIDRRSWRTLVNFFILYMCFDIDCMNVKLKQCVRQLMQSQQGWSQRETQSPEENLVRFTVCATVLKGVKGISLCPNYRSWVSLNSGLTKAEFYLFSRICFSSHSSKKIGCLQMFYEEESALNMFIRLWREKQVVLVRNSECKCERHTWISTIELSLSSAVLLSFNFWKISTSASPNHPCPLREPEVDYFVNLVQQIDLFLIMTSITSLNVGEWRHEWWWWKQNRWQGHTVKTRMWYVTMLSTSWRL